MLIQIGPVVFDVFPLNTHEYSRDAKTDFASKAVVGSRPLLEYVGEGEETYKFSGKLFPKHSGGLNELAQLHAVRQMGIPQMILRGDGKLLGWFDIESISETSTYLDASGVGQVIEFEVSVKNAARPSPAAFALSLFGAL